MKMKEDKFENLQFEVCLDNDRSSEILVPSDTKTYSRIFHNLQTSEEHMTAFLNNT